MKNAIIVILTLCLGVSLWISRQDRKTMRKEMLKLQAAVESRQASPASAAEEADGKTPTDPGPHAMMPKAPPSIDFSGTAFEDDSWKLDNKAKSTAPTMRLPTATLNDSESQSGTIPDGPGHPGSAGSGSNKGSSFKSILTNPGN